MSCSDPVSPTSPTLPPSPYSPFSLSLSPPSFSHSPLSPICSPTPFPLSLSGGHQSFNIFGGDDTPTTDPQPPASRGGRRAAKEVTANVGSAPIEPARPTLTPHTSSIATVFNDSPAPAAAAASQSTTPRVNNIWGSDDTTQRSSTRVLRGPGGGSSGVAGALGGDGPAEPEGRKTGVYRGNQTSSNSPFSSEPQVQRSSTRVREAPGGTGSGNILSWGH